MDPWETFQAIKAADKLTETEGKLRHSTRGADQLLDPWERFQALKAADRLTAMEGKLRQNRRGADQLNLDFHHPKERKDVRMPLTQSDSQTRLFVNNRRPVDTLDHVNSLGDTGVYQHRTMQTESRRLSTLYYSGNFAGETGLHTLQQQRLRVLQPFNGSRGPFSEVEDWFAAKYITGPKQELYKSSARGPFSEVDDWFTAKYITGPKQELYKSSAQQKISTQNIAGVHPSSYSAQDFTDSSSTVTITESMDVDLTDDTSSDVSEISCRFNGIDLNGLSEDSNSTIAYRKKAWNIGLNLEKPQKSTTIYPLYSSTGPNSGGYKGKSQSRNVTVSHILAAKQESTCVQKYADDLAANKVTDTVPDKSLKSFEQQKTSTEDDVDEHPSSPEVRNNIVDLLSLTEPMPVRATDDTSSYVPKLIYMYPLDSTGLDELSDDCESIITETVDIPKSETKELSTLDKISRLGENNDSEKRDGSAKSEHLVGTDNPDIINSCTFKNDVKPTERDSIDSSVSQAIQQIEDTLNDISAYVSDSKPHATVSEILIIEKKTTEQVVNTPETPEAKKDPSGREKSIQTNQDHLQQREVKEEVETEVVPTELTSSSDNGALSETSTKDNRDGCASYPRPVLSMVERCLGKETDPQQASGEISTLYELDKLKSHEDDDQSNRPTDRGNADMFDKVKEDITVTGSSLNIEKTQTTGTDDQKVKDTEKKDKQEEEERKNREILETEEALQQKETKLAYERTETHLREFQKMFEQTTANEKANDENKDRQEKEERKERDILEIEEALMQDNTELAYEKIDKHLKEFQKKLEEKYVGSRSDNSFIRGGNINVTIQCGVLTSEYLNPPPVTQPVPSENITSAYIDGHKNYPNGECSQTGSRMDIQAQKQTKHIKKCKNCGSTRLNTVCESSSLISVTSVSQSSPRFLVDSMQGDQCDDHEKIRERILHSPVQAEQSTAHDKARIVNIKRIGMQRELQQRKSKPLPTIRYGEADPSDTDRVKRRHSRKARNEGSPITAQSPPSRSTDTNQIDTEPKEENRVKRNILKPKRSEDKYRVGSKNEACSEKSQVETVKTSHSKRERSKDDFTDIFATETAEYQCQSSDKTKESSSIPKDMKINEVSLLRPTSSDDTDTTIPESSTDLSCVSNKSSTKYQPEESQREKEDREVSKTCDKSPELEKQNTKSGRKNVHQTKRNREASPKTKRDRSPSRSSDSDDSTDSGLKSNRRKSGKPKSRLKRSTGPTRTRQQETSPKSKRDRSSSTTSESDDLTDSDQKSNRGKSGKSKSRRKQSTGPTRTRQQETSPKSHRDRSSSTSSESDNSTDSDLSSKRERTGKSGSKVKLQGKQSTGPTKTSGKPLSLLEGKSSNGKRRIQSKQKSKNPVSTSSEVAVNESVENRKNEKSDNSSAHISNDNIVVKKKGQYRNIKNKNRRLETPSKTNTEDDTTSETKCCLSSSVPEKQSSNENRTDSRIEKTKSRKRRDANSTSGKRKVRPEYGEETSDITDDSSTVEWSDSLQSENNILNSQTTELYTTKVQPDSRTSETLKNPKRKTTADPDKTSEVRKASESEHKKDRESKRESKDLSEVTPSSTIELTDQNKSDREAKQTQDSKQRSIPSCRIDTLQDSDSWLSSTTTSSCSTPNEVQPEKEQMSSGHSTSTNVQGNDDDTVGSSLSTTDTYSDSEIEDNEGDEKKENEHTNVDKIRQKEKRKDEIAELKKRLEEVKRIDKAEKHSQENQKKKQKTMEKLDKELDKKRKEIEKVNLKREQRQIKNDKDEEKNALKEEKRVQKMQMKQEKEEQSKIKKEEKKAENEEKKLEKLRNEIKKVEEKQASKIVKTEERNTDENDDDNDEKCNGGDQKVNDNASDSDAIFDDDSEGENTRTEHDDVSGKVGVKNKITEIKEKLQEAKRLEKAEKRTREFQKKDEKAKKKLDEKHEREKKKQEKVARKKEQRRLKDEKDKVKKLLNEKKKFLEKQLKQKKKEQAKIQKEAKKAAKDAEKQRKKSAKTQKDVQKKEQKKALKKEPKHDDDDEKDDDLDNEVNDSDIDQDNNDEVDDGQNQQADSDKMNENVEIIQNEIAAIKEELEEVKMTEEAEKHQSKSDEKNEKAIEKLDKEMEREKKKMEEMDRKLELKQKKIEKDEEKKMLKEEKKIFEKLMKEEKKEQSRITKEAKKAEKEKEKGRKKAEKEVEKERKKAEQEKEKQRKKAEKEQKDAQKKEEKEAEKAAEKEQKEAAKVVKKREKEQKEKEKRDKMYKKKEQQKEKKLEKKKQKEESKLLAFRRKKEMERQSRMKKAEEQREKEEKKRKTAEKETAQKEEIKHMKDKRKKEKKRWKLIEKRDKFVLKQEKEEYEQRERENIILRYRNGLNNANLSLSEDSLHEITKDESSPDTSSSDSLHEITKKESSPIKPSSVIPTEDCENEYMEIFQNCASNESDSPCDGFAPDSFGHLTVRDHDDIDDKAVRSRQYQMKEKKINLVVEFQKYLAKKARSQKSEESNNPVSNQSPSGNNDTNNEQVLSFPPCTGSQHKTDAKEKSDVLQNSQPPEQLEEQTLPCRWIDKTERPNHHSLNADLPKSTQNASLKPDVVKPAGDKDDEKGSHIGSSNKSKAPEEIQSCATGDKSHSKEAGAKSAGNLSFSKSTKVNRTPEAIKSVRTGKEEGKGAHGNMIKSKKDTDDQTGSGYHSWDDSDEEIDVQKKTSVMNLDERRGIEVDFVPEYSYNSWDDTDEETEVEKKPSIMKLNEMKGIDIEFVPEYSYNSWDDTDDEDTIEREIKDVMGENLDIYEPKPTPPVEEKEPDILADPLLKELYGDEYEDVCGFKEKK